MIQTIGFTLNELDELTVQKNKFYEDFYFKGKSRTLDYSQSKCYNTSKDVKELYDNNL